MLLLSPGRSASDGRGNDRFRYFRTLWAGCIEHFREFGARADGDSDKVKLANSVGYLTLDTASHFGDTVLTYWPNAFSDPDVFFKVTN
jgi:hypothetical protein